MFYRPVKRFLSLRGFDLVIMYSIFFGIFGLPYRLASLLIIILLTKITAAQNEITLDYHRMRGLYFLADFWRLYFSMEYFKLVS